MPAAAVIDDAAADDADADADDDVFFSLNSVGGNHPRPPRSEYLALDGGLGWFPPLR
jgi:hypothetical protein